MEQQQVPPSSGGEQSAPGVVVEQSTMQQQQLIQGQVQGCFQESEEQQQVPLSFPSEQWPHDAHHSWGSWHKGHPEREQHG